MSESSGLLLDFVPIVPVTGKWGCMCVSDLCKRGGLAGFAGPGLARRDCAGGWRTFSAFQPSYGARSGSPSSTTHVYKRKRSFRIVCLVIGSSGGTSVQITTLLGQADEPAARAPGQSPDVGTAPLWTITLYLKDPPANLCSRVGLSCRELAD
jgi:hypothetical protein